jgi:hypothetical protein
MTANIRFRTLTLSDDFESWIAEFDKLTFTLRKKPEERATTLLNHLHEDVLRAFHAPPEGSENDYVAVKDALKKLFLGHYKPYFELKRMEEMDFTDPQTLKAQFHELGNRFAFFAKQFVDQMPKDENRSVLDHPFFIQMALRLLPEYATRLVAKEPNVSHRDLATVIGYVINGANLGSQSAQRDASTPAPQLPRTPHRISPAPSTPTKICSYCKRHGHEMKDCRKLAKDQRDQSSEGNMAPTRLSFGTPSGPKRKSGRLNPNQQVKTPEDGPTNLFVEVAIIDGKGKRRDGLVACLDTGANLSYISSEVAHTLGLELKPCSIETRLADGREVPVKFSTRLNLTTNGVVCGVHCGVMNGLATHILLGLNAVQELGLMLGSDGEGGWYVLQRGKPLRVVDDDEAAEVLTQLSSIPPADVSTGLLLAATPTGSPLEISIDPELSEAFKSLCLHTLDAFEDVFYKPGESRFWQASGTEHKIPLVDASFPKAGTRKYSPKKQAIIERQFEEWRDLGIIERCPASNFRNFPVVVDKSGGKHRVCFDYRGLNRITLREPYPSKNLLEVLNKFQGAKWISKLDLTSS